MRFFISLLILFQFFLTGCDFSSRPNWKNYESEEFGISIDCPYPMSLDKLSDGLLDGMQKFGLAPDILVHFIVEKNENKTNFDSFINNEIKSSKTNDFEVKIANVTVSGMPATLLTIKSKQAPSQRFELHVFKNNQSWWVTIMSFAIHKESIGMTNRVIDSIKIQPKNQ